MTRRTFLQAAVGLAAAPPPRRVWLIGDSNGWLLKPVLARHAQDCVYGGSPVPGSSVLSWSREHDREIALLRRFQPDILIVALGANDAYMGKSIIRNELPYLMRMLARLRGKVVWLGPPDLPKARPGLAAFADMIRGAGLPYLDSREVRISMWDDQLHPDEKGREAWAAWAWPRVAAFP